MNLNDFKSYFASRFTIHYIDTKTEINISAHVDAFKKMISNQNNNLTNLVQNDLEVIGFYILEDDLSTKYYQVRKTLNKQIEDNGKIHVLFETNTLEFRSNCNLLIADMLLHFGYTETDKISNNRWYQLYIAYVDEYEKLY